MGFYFSITAVLCDLSSTACTYTVVLKKQCLNAAEPEEMSQVLVLFLLALTQQSSISSDTFRPVLNKYEESYRFRIA